LETAGDRFWLEVAFGRNEKIHALRVLLPARPSAAVEAPGTNGSASNAAQASAPAQGGSYRLLFGSGSAVFGPNTSGLRCDRSGVTGKKKKKRLAQGEEEASGQAGGLRGDGHVQKKVKVGKKAKKAPH
jgi:hypothetical protein